MNLKPSIALRNEYQQVTALAKASGEPIIIANKGEADLVFLSVEAFEERGKYCPLRRRFRSGVLQTGRCANAQRG